MRDNYHPFPPPLCAVVVTVAAAVAGCGDSVGGGDRPVNLGARRRKKGHIVPALRRQQQGTSRRWVQFSTYDAKR